MDAIRRSITIEAPIDLVWVHLTESERIAAWLMPNTFRADAGAEFTMDCPPGIGSGAPVQCQIREIEPPAAGRARLVYSWEIDQPLIETVLAIDLREEGGATRLDLVHSGWDKLDPDDAHVWDRHEQGWDQILIHRLVPLVTGSAPPG